MTESEQILAEALEGLRARRERCAALHEEITALEAPHKAAIEAATGALRAEFKALQAEEDAYNEVAREAYESAALERHEDLMRGVPRSSVTLPQGWAVQLRTTVAIADPDAVPRALCKPDTALVKAAVKSGAVPGATVQKLPVFLLKD